VAVDAKNEARAATKKPAGDGQGDLFPWDDLQFFLELARKSTLARAARRLGVSHTTVLRRIANLERALDRKVFDRTSGGFVLNEAGWHLLEHAEEMERAADSIFHLGDGKSALSGTVRVAVIEGLATRVLTPAFRDFRAQHPEVLVEVVTAMQIVNLTKREADISVGLTRPTGPRLIARLLAKGDVHLYASDAYLREHGEPNSLDELDGHLFVDYVEDLIEIQALKWFRDTMGQRDVVFRSTSPLTQLEAVRDGIGIGMFPDYLIRDDDAVKQVLPDEVNAEREFWLAIHADLRNVPRMAAVFNFVKEVFHGDPKFRRPSAARQ
jgi:DNA-binding transcriptional LysR family regulator